MYDYAADNTLRVEESCITVRDSTGTQVVRSSSKIDSSLRHRSAVTSPYGRFSGPFTPDVVKLDKTASVRVSVPKEVGQLTLAEQTKAAVQDEPWLIKGLGYDRQQR